MNVIRKFYSSDKETYAMAKKKKVGGSKKRPKSIIEDEVRQLMKDSGHTTYRIAKMANLPLPTVYRFTSGRGRMEFHTLEKLLGALGYELHIRRKKATRKE
jgi:predicted transcriptional regulator